MRIKALLCTTAILLTILAMGFLASDAEAYTYQDTCKTCSAEICIPVYEEYGYSNCNENYTYTYAYIDIWGHTHTRTTTMCKVSDPCLTPPPA